MLLWRENVKSGVSSESNKTNIPVKKTTTITITTTRSGFHSPLQAIQQRRHLHNHSGDVMTSARRHSWAQFGKSVSRDARTRARTESTGMLFILFHIGGNIVPYCHPVVKSAYCICNNNNIDHCSYN